MNGLRIVAEACVTDVLSVLVAVAVGCVFHQCKKPHFVGWLVLYIVADNIAGLLPTIFHWNFGQWNWIGQTASLAFSLLIAIRYFSREEVGLRLPRTRQEVLWTVGGVLVALAIAVGTALAGPGGHVDIETFAYQATLPGPVEELAFRGIGLALLLRAFSSGQRDRKAEWIAVLVTAIWFTSEHVVHFEHEKLQIIWLRTLDALPIAVVFAVIRLRSGSLLGGTLAHNAANTLIQIIAAIRA